MDLGHSPERISSLRRHQAEVHADLVSRSIALPLDSNLRRGGVLRPFVREYLAHDEDGVPLGTRRQRVNDIDVDGALRPAAITILSVYRDVEVEELTQDYALACGYKTATGAREAWRERHPRSPLCHVVCFALGDVRDRPLFLNWTGRAGGDYVASLRRAMDDAEVLTPDQLAALSSWNHQKDDARRAKASQALRVETPSQRLARLQRVVDRLGAEAERAIRQEKRIIRQRIDRAEGRP